VPVAGGMGARDRVWLGQAASSGGASSLALPGFRELAVEMYTPGKEHNLPILRAHRRQGQRKDPWRLDFVEMVAYSGNWTRGPAPKHGPVHRHRRIQSAGDK